MWNVSLSSTGSLAHSTASPPQCMPTTRGHAAVATSSNTHRHFTIDYETQIASRAASSPPHCLVFGAVDSFYTNPPLRGPARRRRDPDTAHPGDSPTRVAARGNPGWRSRQQPTTHQIRPLPKTHTPQTYGGPYIPPHVRARFHRNPNTHRHTQASARAHTYTHKHMLARKHVDT